jgi:hypothetical protein
MKSLPINELPLRAPQTDLYPQDTIAKYVPLMPEGCLNTSDSSLRDIRAVSPTINILEVVKEKSLCKNKKLSQLCNFVL